MVCIFTVAFIAEPLPFPRDDVDTFLGTVIAAFLAIHIIVFPIGPAFLKLRVPKVLDSGP